MQDICDKNKIEISPKLRNIFRRHFDRDYVLAWYIGIINRYVSRPKIKQAIRERYLGGMKRHEERFGESKGTAKFREGTIAFLNDFDSLDFAEIDILRQLKPKEALAKPIRTINDMEVVFTEE